MGPKLETFLWVLAYFELQAYCQQKLIVTIHIFR